MNAPMNWITAVTYPGGTVVHQLRDLAAAFEHAQELVAMTPPLEYIRTVAEDARVGVSPDGRFLYSFCVENVERSESGRVTYASGDYRFTFYRVADRGEVARWSGSYAWNDANGGHESGTLKAWGFSPDGRSFVLERGAEKVVVPLTDR